MDTGKTHEDQISDSGDADLDAAPVETMESLLAQQESLVERLSGKKVAWVKVIQVTKDSVLVDIGEKREGIVPLSEFIGEPEKSKGKPGSAPQDKEAAPAVGQRIPVIFSGSAKGQGPTTLSYKRAKAELGWETAKKAFAEKSRIRGQVVSAIKGGFLVDVGGLSGFLPASLADLRPVREPARMVGTGVRCYIIEINEPKRQLVLSRKAVLEEEAGKRRTLLLSELRIGEVRIGRIIHSGPAGLLVDIGGAEGLVHPVDIAWGVPKPDPKLERGAKVKVKVLSKPQEGEKVSLGIKQLTANPAEAIKKKFPPKTIVRGKILEISATGVKIKLDSGTPAFSPLSECEEFAKLKVGDAITALVSGVDSTTFEILVSVNRYNDIQDRKRMAQYLKAPPPLTLGQLLSRDTKEE